MTLDEAIAKYKEITNTDANCPIHCMRSCDKCVQESGQLAEWLEELKSYRAFAFSGDMTQKMLKEEYNKAVNDFAKLLRETRDDRTLRVNCDDLEIRHMAERLKGGDGE